MNFKTRQPFVLSLMVSTLIASSGYATQRSVVGYHLGREVDSPTASTFLDDHAKFLEYKNEVQPLSDMPPGEYLKIKTSKPHAPVAELVSTHIARQELGRLNIVPTSAHEEAASHLLSVAHKDFDTSYLESVIDLQTDPDKTGLVDKKPSTARITAMAFFKKESHKPSEPELDVMAYIMNPEDVKIKKPKPEEFQAALYLMDIHVPVIAKPTADEIQAAAFLLGGVMGKPSRTEVEAAAYLMAGPIPKPTAREVVAAEALLAGPILKPIADEVKGAEDLMRMHVPPTAATVAAILYFKLPTIRIAKPGPEFLKAAAYLLNPLDPVIEKPTPEEIQAAEVLLDRVKMTAPTAPEVRATLILWASQFGQKPYVNASVPHIQAVSKGTTDSQKFLIAWFIQKTGGNIPGGVAEALTSDFHYEYFKFVPVGFDVMASKAATCLFSAGNYGSTGTDGFRVFKQAYATGLKEGEQCVFDTLVCDKARTDAVTITGIDKP
jgi:hypothetical protein